MRRHFLTILLCLLSLSAFGQRQAIRDIDISVTMADDGSINITEVWDVSVVKGTEWYLVRSNLGDIDITNLSVVDETGRVYVNEGRWDVDRNLDRKAGRCGLVTKKNGYEICWGLGSYGDHTYTVSYTMTNAVKSLHEEDMLHLQFISSNLSSEAQHAKITISKPGTAIDTLNSSIWAFGYDGFIWFEDGKIVAETESPLESDNSMIVLARFEKGIFQPTSIVDESFSEHLQRALDGSDYYGYESESETEDVADWIVTIFCVLMPLIVFISPILIGLGLKSKGRKDALGQKNFKDIEWSRSIPYEGNLETSYKALVDDVAAGGKKCSLAGAIVLKLIKEGYLYIYKDAKDKTLIMFNEEKDRSTLPESESLFFNLLLEASGKDKVLQEKEFSKWADSHGGAIIKWDNKVKSEASRYAKDHGYKNGSKYTDAGRAMNRTLLGFKKYLEDFTIINERQAVEVTLWQDYLIFATIYGIADKVAKDLKDINPVVFEQSMGMEYTSLFNTMRTIQSIGDTVRVKSMFGSTGKYGGGGRSFGGGGRASFGGGGGFSGGGVGGGCR